MDVPSLTLLIALSFQLFCYGSHIYLLGKRINLFLQLTNSIQPFLELVPLLLTPFQPTFEVHIAHKLLYYLLNQIASLSISYFWHRSLHPIFVLKILNYYRYTLSKVSSIF